MYYVYVLKNEETKELYYGYTNNLKRRLKEHNPALISQRRPLEKINAGWRLIYYEAYTSELDAREREKKLKHYGQSRKHLVNRIKRSLQL